MEKTTESLKSKEKVYGFDIIRALACIMVVILHSPKPGNMANDNGIFLSALSFFTAPCIPLFFMLSGALLMGSTMNTEKFLKKRFRKFVMPLILWSIIYLIDKVVLGKINTFDTFLKCVLSIPFSPQEGVLWFMYTLSGLYLLAPVLSPWLLSQSKKVVVFYLCLWGITLCYPYLDNLLYLHNLMTPNADILYYFSGYAGYFVLGWFLKNKPIHQNNRNLIILVIGCVFFTCYKITDKICHLGIDENDGFYFQSLAIAFFSVFWWYTCLSLSKLNFIKSNIIKTIIKTIANYSFGIYLCHILIMRPYLWNSPLICHITNYPLQTFTIVAFDFGLSLLLCYLISYLPFSKYIIAYHRE